MRPDRKHTWSCPAARVAIAAASLALFAAASAQAQTSVWSAILTVGDLTGDVKGCSNSVLNQDCSDSSNLTQDGFTYATVDYEVVALLVRPSGRLEFQVNADLESSTNDLTLSLDGENFKLSEGGSANQVRRWDNSNLSWTVSDTINVELFDETNVPPLAPAAPILAPSPRRTDSVLVNWTAPDNTGRPVIGTYDIRYSDDGGDSWSDGPQDVTSTPATVTGLDENALIQVQVRATNSAGDGPWSNESEVYTNPAEETVNGNYGLIPSGLSKGDKFRLLYVTSASTSAQDANAAGHHGTSDQDLRTLLSEGFAISLKFTQRALISTPGVAARVHTNTLHNETDPSVPIYWMRGAKIADDYADFYDGDWDDEANPKDGVGRAHVIAMQPWTGSASDGTELMDGGNSRAVGQSQVGIAGLNSSTAGEGPLASGSTAANTEERPLYALLHVMVVGDSPLTSNSGQQVNLTDDRSAKRSQRFTTGSNAGGYDLGSVTVYNQDEEDDAYSVAIYTVDSNGHPDAVHASLTAPDSFDSRTEFTAPTGTTLTASTTYALVIEPGTAGTDVQLRTTSSDDEDERGAGGWSIRDAFDYESGGSWQVDSDSEALAVEIWGTVKPSSANSAPAFGSATATADVDENTPSGTNIAAANQTATDPNGETLTYSLVQSGSDPGWEKFAVDEATGQLQTKDPLDHEDDDTHVLIVRATDPRSASDDLEYTITVNDVNEPPTAPNMPSVNAVSSSSTSLRVSWTAPANTGKPPITSYALQYREGTSGAWTAGPMNLGTTSTTLSSLTPDTIHQIQVKAVNDEGESGWSTEGEGRTNPTSGNNAPEFNPGSVTRTVAENTAAGLDIGSPITATDVDGDTLTYSLVGADSAAFAIVATSGQIRTSAPLDFETKSTYSFQVEAEDTNGGSGRASVAIDVTNVSEVPAAPAAPTVSAPPGTDNRLDVSWTAPNNVGKPPIASYDLQYREGTSGTWLNGPQDVAGTSAPISNGLSANTLYQVQLRASNADGDSDWSPPGSGRTSEPTRPRRPHPLQLALWTDRPAYQAGDPIQLRYTLRPHDDREYDYQVFFYLELVGGGQRSYLAPLGRPPGFHEQAVDQRGRPASSGITSRLQAGEKVLAWEGTAPQPGLWQFIMELRPDSAREQGSVLAEDLSEGRVEPPPTRRAWAKFVVAAHSRLVIRRGLSRELSTDLTLQGDTLYYLMAPLFVQDGATLTIEPGTVVLAWGSNTAIIVERGGRIVAEGTRQAPVVLTCSRPVGQRYPGCWGGLRILGRAPVTRLEGIAGGVSPPGRLTYGGPDPHDSSGTLRYVRVEFAGVDNQAGSAFPGVGFYGVGDGTAVDYLQVRASLGPGLAFSGGTAGCDHCVSSGSGEAGLQWERGWRGTAAHLYVQHGEDGLHGLDGINDPQGYSFEPRSLPTLSHVTLVHTHPYASRAHDAVGVRVHMGSGVHARDLLAMGFGDGAVEASARSTLMFIEGESWVSGALLHGNGWLPGKRQLRGAVGSGVEFIDRKPELRDVRDFANPDPRPRSDSPAILAARPPAPPAAGAAATVWDGDWFKEAYYIGAFGDQENWLEEWTVFGPEHEYDVRAVDE